MRACVPELHECVLQSEGSMLPALVVEMPLFSTGDVMILADARVCATQLTAVKCGCDVCHQGRRLGGTDRSLEGSVSDDGG
jgi:hypothetical protein